jgi:FKBP-type peptidyl-prolyl cis-trans isomerase
MIFALLRFWTQFNYLILPCRSDLAKQPIKKITHMAQEVKAGDTVKVHYQGRLSDGTTFDSSEGRSPLEY